MIHFLQLRLNVLAFVVSILILMGEKRCGF